jgi:hypothetical protein
MENSASKYGLERSGGKIPDASQSNVLENI